MLTKLRDLIFPSSAALREQSKALRQEVKRLRQALDRSLALLHKIVEQQEKIGREQSRAASEAKRTVAAMARLDERLKQNGERLDALDRKRKEDARRHGWELKGVKYWSKVFEGQLQAMLRKLYLEPDELPYPHRLVAKRFRLFSQNQEDGLTLAILRAAGFGPRRFVEIGSGMNGGNSGFLAADLGWSGLMVDCDAYKVERLARRTARGVKGVASWVTRENINELLRDNGMEGEVDLFSIDIDGADYWIWDALEVCSPRLVAIEFNSLFGTERAVTVPYESSFDRHDMETDDDWGRYFYGASLPALIRLGRRKGYRLVATEPEGANAFFLRDDLAPEIPEASAREAFHMAERLNVQVQKTGESIYDFIERQGLSLVEID